MILKELSPGIVKLGTTGLLARVLKNATGRTNAGKMSVELVISTEDEDRSGDIVVTKGIDLGDHRKNPIGLFNHDKDAPVGRFCDPLGSYTVKARGGRELVGELFFNQRCEFAHDVFRRVEDKTFSAASIGFLPVADKVEKRLARGTLYKGCRMVEASVLPLGDNPNAIVEAVHKQYGGKAASPEFIQYLTPYIPERAPVVTGGWETKAMPVTKALPMDEEDTLQGAAGADAVDPMAPDAGGVVPDVAPADPNAAPSPHAQHDEAIHDGTEQHIAALWNKYRGQGLSVSETLDKMKVALEANEKLVGRGGDEGDDLDLDADEDEDDDFEDSDDAPELDLNDDDKDKAEKAMYAEWVQKYCPTMSGVAKALVQIGTHPNTTVEKIQGAIMSKILPRMESLPEIDGVIEKALAGGVVSKASATPMDDLPDSVLAEAAAVLAEARATKAEIFG